MDLFCHQSTYLLKCFIYLKVLHSSIDDPVTIEGEIFLVPTGALSEGVQKERVFLGLCPKLWMGGGLMRMLML